MYLLDTNILSALLLRGKPTDRDIAVRDWLFENSDNLFISVISITEIEVGIAKAERQGASKKAADLANWLRGILDTQGHRILPLDVLSARLAGRLLDKAYGLGAMPDFEDAAIAATAVTHGLHVLTRNARHFDLFDVAPINPFDRLP